MEITGSDIYFIVVVVLSYLILSHLFGSRNKLEGYSTIVPTSPTPDYSENTYWDPSWVGKRSNDCYELSERDCMKYSNCGLCLKDGKAQCIPGDQQGPLFKESCERWIHTDYRDRYIFGEKVVTVTPPFDYFYPDYEARYPSPQSRASLIY